MLADASIHIPALINTGVGLVKGGANAAKIPGNFSELTTEAKNFPDLLMEFVRNNDDTAIGSYVLPFLLDYTILGTRASIPHAYDSWDVEFPIPNLSKKKALHFFGYAEGSFGKPYLRAPLISTFSLGDKGHGAAGARQVGYEIDLALHILKTYFGETYDILQRRKACFEEYESWTWKSFQAITKGFWGKISVNGVGGYATPSAIVPLEMLFYRETIGSASISNKFLIGGDRLRAQTELLLKLCTAAAEKNTKLHMIPQHAWNAQNLLDYLWLRMMFVSGTADADHFKFDVFKATIHTSMLEYDDGGDLKNLAGIHQAADLPTAWFFNDLTSNASTFWLSLLIIDKTSPGITAPTVNDANIPNTGKPLKVEEVYTRKVRFSLLANMRGYIYNTKGSPASSDPGEDTTSAGQEEDEDD
jgi:hypothetical protein